MFFSLFYFLEYVFNDIILFTFFLCVFFVSISALISSVPIVENLEKEENGNALTEKSFLPREMCRHFLPPLFLPPVPLPRSPGGL